MYSSFILPLHRQGPRLEKGGNSHRSREEFVSNFQSSQTFCVLSASNFAALFWAKREKFTPKNVSKSWHSDAKIFHFNRTPISHDTHLWKTERHRSCVTPYQFPHNCHHHQDPQHCLHHGCHDDNGNIIAIMTALSSQSIKIFSSYSFAKSSLTFKVIWIIIFCW